MYAEADLRMDMDTVMDMNTEQSKLYQIMVKA